MIDGYGAETQYRIEERLFSEGIFVNALSFANLRYLCSEAIDLAQSELFSERITLPVSVKCCRLLKKAIQQGRREWGD